MVCACAHMNANTCMHLCARAEMPASTCSGDRTQAECGLLVHVGLALRIRRGESSEVFHEENPAGDVLFSRQGSGDMCKLGSAGYQRIVGDQGTIRRHALWRYAMEALAVGA